MTHFRSEFIRHSQATILRRVTMTQFMLVIVCLGVGLGILRLLLWLAPALMVAGYAASYIHQGQILLKRWLAPGGVALRTLLRRPRLVNVHAEWERVRHRLPIPNDQRPKTHSSSVHLATVGGADTVSCSGASLPFNVTWSSIPT